MKSVLMSFCLLAGLAFAEGNPAPLIANIPGRTVTSLNGTWRTIIDPYNTGLQEKFYLSETPKDPEDRFEYDFDASAVLKVPGDWNSQRELLLLYEGSIWYKKAFTYHPKPGRRTFLYFGAANYRAAVYLNGEKLGEHVGGYTPFNFEVTGKLKDGANFVVVEVNNSRRADAVPALSTDWWNYGGLTRDVMLVDVPEAFIENYFVQLAKGKSDEIAGWVKLSGATAPQQVTIAIPEAGVRQVVTTDAAGYGRFSTPAKVSLWSPENPKLYEVTVSSPTDKLTDEIGFRTVETRGDKILLNGKPIFLRGISVHEEAPFRSGRAFSPEDDLTLLNWAKELGCNFVRLAHYPHNEAMTRLADKMGLLVWSEIPVYWDIDWNNAATLANAEQQLHDMMARDYNRASIVLWSIANETPITPTRNQFLKKLADAIRQQDSTRLVTAAMNRTGQEGNTRLVDDPLGEFIDVLSVNEYIGWYEGKPEDADRTDWKTSWQKPVIFSEFGAGALYGNHGTPKDRWTEEYQARLYEHQLKMIQRVPGFAGVSPWVLMDFRSPRRFQPVIQDFHNRKGVVSNRGERKQAFYILQKFYREMAAKEQK